MELLSSILSEDPKKLSKEQQILWFARLLRWFQRPRSRDEKSERWETIYSLRLKFLLVQLDKSDDWKHNFIQIFNSVLIELSEPFQLMGSGMPTENGFLQDFINRLQEKLLPNTPLENDVETLITDIFDDQDESLLIAAMDKNVLSNLIHLLDGNDNLGLVLRTRLLEALRILSIQMLEGSLSLRVRLGIQDTNRFTFPEFELEENVFYNLIQNSDQSLETVWKQLNDIQEMTDLLFEQMKKRGVRTEIVYSFQVHRKRLKRFRVILNMLDRNQSTAESVRLFVSQLVVDIHEQRSLFSFLRSNLSLLSKQVVEANSQVGEHYIARSWDDFYKMLLSAMGGGAVTSLTVFIKYAIVKINFTGFLKGFFEGVNYSISFSIIQILGFTLATKQPSTTAPFINRSIHRSLKEGGQTILALLRTQFIAVFGNLTTVFPICLFISAFAMWLGHPLFSYDECKSMFQANQLLGPSMFYACFTGVLLFSSSIFAGWFENFCVVTHLPKRIQYNKRINRWLGIQRSERLANFLDLNGNALAANISLGFILGMAPTIISFLGLPIEVRHVTLATGTFAAALPMMFEHGAVNLFEFFNVVAGILIIGIFNISVSFLLAISLASVSSRTNLKTIFKLFKWSGLKILRRPWILLIPEDEN